MSDMIVQKIFKQHSRDNVNPGNIIWLDIDIKTARDFRGANVIKNLKQYYKDSFIYDLNKTYFAFDTSTPVSAKDIALYIIKKLGSAGALGKIVKIYGESIDNMELYEKITISSIKWELYRL